MWYALPGEDVVVPNATRGRTFAGHQRPRHLSIDCPAPPGQRLPSRKRRRSRNVARKKSQLIVSEDMRDNLVH
jgi:hypothetical protein